MNKTIYSVIGGDERFNILARLIASKGHTTFTAGFDVHSDDAAGVIKTDAATAAAMADVIILPLPASTDGAVINAPFSQRAIRLDDELISAMSHSRIYTGFAGKLRKQQPAFEGLELYDYSVQESFLIKNAQATAEAVLMLAIANMPTVITGSRVLVAGCGRIGRFTALMLRQLGAHVCGASRSPENAAFISSLGIKTLGYTELPELMEKFDLVVNTADAMVITEQLISRMRRDALIIDVASYPGGTDFDAARLYGVNAMHALGLPGKYSPATAAKVIFETITGMEGEKHT